MTGRGPAPEAAAAGGRLAELWLGCYERLAAAAAHEVNNALNGVSMNLEVVRLRARPGADAGLVVPFAAGAVAEQEVTVALAGALVALGRTPARAAGADVAAVLGHAAALYAPLLRHQQVALAVDAPDVPVVTGAPARAVRLAVCTALELAALPARPGPAGGDPAPPLRCTLQTFDGPTLVVAPAPGAWPDDVRAALAAVGVRVTLAPEGLLAAFPPA